MKCHVMNDGGFSFGMDDRTPVQWRFTPRQLKRGVYMSSTMPDYMRDWCRANPSWIGSKRDLLALCASIKAGSAA